jgi:pSer/pThr/pTyr-binding forkhead associated (FHA) protein
MEADETDQLPQFEGQDEGPPKLILTFNGKTLRKMTMNRPRVLIGRSEHNDLCIDSTYISRHHAMFVKFGPATLLMDLNSKNGTLVNSRRVSNQVMINNDIISLGHHRIKFVDPSATERSPLDGDSFADTAIMKDLSDMRVRIARETTVSLPGPPDSTGGTPKR